MTQAKWQNDSLKKKNCILLFHTDMTPKSGHADETYSKSQEMSLS